MRERAGDMAGLRRFWLNTVCGSPLWSSRVRVRLLRLGGVDAQGCGVRHGVAFIGRTNVTLADGVFVNTGVMLDGAAHIQVGRNVALAPGVKLLTSSHEVGPPDRRAGDGQSTYAPVSIGDGCWLGAGVIVLPGVTIGPGCIIAAGAVVTSDCKPNSLYAGVPAIWRRELPND